MRIFDPHIHMTSRTTDDYEAMYAAGVRAVVEPAFWLGQPRTSPESFYDYFDGLLGWSRTAPPSSASSTSAPSRSTRRRRTTPAASRSSTNWTVTSPRTVLSLSARSATTR